MIGTILNSAGTRWKIGRFEFATISLVLVVARLFMHASLGLGMTDSGDGSMSTDLALLFLGELFLILAFALCAIGRLRDVGWPVWLASAPVILTVLSSPTLLQLEDFWIERGWQVAHVFNFNYLSNVLLIALFVIFTIAPKSNSNLRDHSSASGLGISDHK